MAKPEPPQPQQWASLLSSRLSSVSNWDPLGIALGTPLRARTPDGQSNPGHIGKRRTLE